MATVSDIQARGYSNAHGPFAHNPVFKRAAACSAAELGSWRKRPLAPCYPFIWLGKTQQKVRIHGHLSRRTVCTVLGLDMAGQMQALGLYASESDGAGFWHSVLTDLAGRGVDDIFVAIVDGLNGFPEATSCLFPRTDIQLRVLYQIRNSMKYVSPKHQKAFMADLKPVYDIYSTRNHTDSERALAALEKKWGRHYPIAVQTWRNKWSNISTWFSYPPAIRELIYATNVIDSAHRQFRMLCRGQDVFNSETALLTSLLAASQAAEGRWVIPEDNWRKTLPLLEAQFTGRIDKST